MRSARLQFLKLGIYTAIGMVSLVGCGIRKKQLTTELKAVSFRDSSGTSRFNSVLVNEQYGASLSGSFNVADTSGTDSTEVVSNGIRIKLKVKGARPGTKVDYKAEATPTARSKLTTSSEQNTATKQGSTAALNQTQTKTVNGLSWWSWLGVVLVLIGIVWLVYQKVKRKLNP